MALMQQPAVEAITLALDNGMVPRLSEESFGFDSELKHIYLQPGSDSYVDEQGAVQLYGDILLNTVIASPSHPRQLITITQDCMSGRLRSLDEVHLALERRLSNTIYIPLIVIILALLALLYWLNNYAFA